MKKPGLNRSSKTFFLLLALSLFLATACQAQKQVLYSQSGLSLEAPAAWRSLSPEDFPELYEQQDDSAEVNAAALDNSTANDAQASSGPTRQQSLDDELRQQAKPSLAHIDLAAARDYGSSGYLVIRRSDQEANIERLKNILFKVADYALKHHDEALEQLRQTGYSEREIERMQPLLDGVSLTPEQSEKLYQEIFLQSHLSRLSMDEERPYSFVGLSDQTIGNLQLPVAQYRYTNAQGVELEEFCCYYLHGTELISIQLWSDSKSFSQHKDEYLAMLKSLTLAQPEQEKDQNTASAASSDAGN